MPIVAFFLGWRGLRISSILNNLWSITIRRLQVKSFEYLCGEVVTEIDLKKIGLQYKHHTGHRIELIHKRPVRVKTTQVGL